MADDLDKLNRHSCPTCGTENFEGARFCRACGNGLTQPLERETQTTQPVPSRPDFLRHLIFWPGRSSKPSIERGLKIAFTGLFFLAIDLITLFVLPGSGTAWWFWLVFFVGFYGLSIGVIEIVRESGGSKRKPSVLSTRLPPAARTQRNDGGLSTATTNQIEAPPSVAEGTTKRLNGSARSENH